MNIRTPFYAVLSLQIRPRRLDVISRILAPAETIIMYHYMMIVSEMPEPRIRRVSIRVDAGRILRICGHILLNMTTESLACSVVSDDEGSDFLRGTIVDAENPHLPFVDVALSIDMGDEGFVHLNGR